MGSDGGCLQPIGCYLNGLLPEKVASQPRGLDMERWMRAEERTTELIARIQPDQPSWESRNAVASYVQHLITQCIPCVVFIYGSVPLKTYLPDGDIDLTVFGEARNSDDNFAAQVRDMLEKEGKKANAEYQIKEVRFINAEVKVVKCLVDSIVVDISFSQLGGLCTLCFLEQVDQHINQNHLFKRSIILIKAWCYYESRLLGAYYGLISTYGLETLILYIFHVFNCSFAGPLEVLYRFLEFFSNFDWDNLCISLQGPVPIRSLPDMTADPHRRDGGALFLSGAFLDACRFYFSVNPSTPEIENQFVSKHFNIIDFLRTNNNLGRSVSRGNFFRIRSAFAFGLQRLARLLDCPKENVVTELNQFFSNTWDMNGKVPRPDTHIVRTYEFVNRYQMEDGEEFDNPGFCFYGTSSSIRHNPENNALFCSEYRERKQVPASAGHANAGNVQWPNNSHKSKECTSDILSGDWSSHLSNMLYARSCQNSPFDGPYFCHPSIVPPRYLERELLPGDPGKPSSRAVNCCALPETAVMPRSHHHSNETSHAGGYQHYPKGIPGYGMGTRTCTPNLKSCREFQSSSPRKQKGKYRYQKEQHGDQENNSNFNSKPRFGGRATPSARNDRVHMQWKALAKQPPLPDQPSLHRVQGSLII